MQAIAVNFLFAVTQKCEGLAIPATLLCSQTVAPLAPQGPSDGALSSLPHQFLQGLLAPASPLSPLLAFSYLPIYQ